MHRGSVAALLLAGGMDASVNAQHVSAIMGVHDVAEAIAGDITPLDGVSKQDKEAMEEVLRAGGGSNASLRWSPLFSL